MGGAYSMSSPEVASASPAFSARLAPASGLLSYSAPAMTDHDIDDSLHRLRHSLAREGNLEPEGCAMPFFAFNADAAAHGGH